MPTKTYSRASHYFLVRIENVCSCYVLVRCLTLEGHPAFFIPNRQNKRRQTNG